MIEQLLVLFVFLTAIGFAIRHYNKMPIEQARNEKGQFIPDDPKTPEVNEAWVGGKAPKAGAKKKKVSKEV